MLFGLLKRKFLAVEGHDGDVSSTNSAPCSPRKKLRVETPASINEVSLTNSQTACAAGQQEGQALPQDAEKQREERVRALRAQLKGFEERIGAIKKETEREAATLKELTEDTMACMVCTEMIQNPQILQCGHTACYSCLRSWWTQPLLDDNAHMIDTVAESDIDGDLQPTVNVPNQAEVYPNPIPAPRPRRRHRFRSAAKRKKYCPHCNAKATCRPTPELRLHDVVETLNDDLAPIPPTIQARTEARLTRRRDVWRGIFPPDEVLVVGPAPVPNPDAIPDDIAQELFQMAVDNAIERRDWERETAYQDGRRAGILETRRQLRREEA